MTKSPTAIAGAPVALAGSDDFDGFLGKLGARDRLNVDRHIAACETEATPDHHRLWRRLATSLYRLAPHSIQTIGQQAVQFYIPDGKYRMQVFGMEDQRDGKVMIYTVDVMKQTLKDGVLLQPRRTMPPSNGFIIKAHPEQTILIEALDAANTPNPSAWYKHMLGWNRKALRITLLTNASSAQIRAAEQVCAIAAKQWKQV
jgi:hypothetical protein